MKIIHLLSLLIVLSVVSCSSWRTVPDKMDAFVENVAYSASEYSVEEWAKSKEDYLALIYEYSEHEDQYTQEEKTRVVKDIGRYHALLLAHSVKEATSFIKTLKIILPSYLEGFKDVIKKNKGGVSDWIKDILDPEGINQAVGGFFDELNSLGEEINQEVEEALEGYGDILEELGKEYN